MSDDFKKFFVLKITCYTLVFSVFLSMSVFADLILWNYTRNGNDHIYNTIRGNIE